MKGKLAVIKKRVGFVNLNGHGDIIANLKNVVTTHVGF